jgi:Bacterial PH domain
MKFHSKKGIILFPILLAVCILMIFTTIMLFVDVEIAQRFVDFNVEESPWPTAVITIPLTIFIIWVVFATYYEIQGEYLKIVSGPIRYTINIHSIQSVKPTNNPLSSPALSIDRLEIQYNKTNKKGGLQSNKSVWSSGMALISPKDKQKFIEELLKVNPDIDVMEKSII